jgi:hypothetical protein
MLRWLGRLVGVGAAAPSSAGTALPGSARVARDRLSLILQSNTRALNDFSMVDMHREIFQVIQARPASRAEEPSVVPDVRGELGVAECTALPSGGA